MVGRWSFPFGAKCLFSGANWLLASGSVQVFLCPFWSPFDAANETHPGGLIFDVQTPGCKMSTSLWTLGSAGFFRNPHSKMLDIYKIIACFKDVLTSLPFWTDDIHLYPKNDEITWFTEVSSLIYSFWLKGTPLKKFHHGLLGGSSQDLDTSWFITMAPFL